MTAREYALQVLEKVFQENGFLSLIMRHSPLSGLDQAFASEIVYGTVRNLSYLEAQWKPYVSRSVNRKTALLLDMSVYQLFFMDKTPAYAVIHEAVSLAGKYEKGFVNAILHKVQNQGKTEVKDLDVQYSHPKWIVELWNAHYGKETTLKILQADQESSVVYGRINTLKTTREHLEGKYTFHNAFSFETDASIFSSEEFRKGKILIQDIHSASIPLYLDVKPGMQVLDVCSAPGTKAQEIAMLMENRGRVVACDVYPQRVQLIEEVMKKTGVTICQAEVRDGTVPHQFSEGQFDRVLLDVPCSGLGDLSHKPEIRWHIHPENLDALVRIQKQLLEANCPYVKKEGMLVYSTCTLNKKENEKQIEAFLERHTDFSLLQQKTFFPFEENGDGFYVAQLIRKE